MYWQKCAKGLGTAAFSAIILVSYVYWQNTHLLNLTTEKSLQFTFFSKPWAIFFFLLLFLASQLYVLDL